MRRARPFLRGVVVAVGVASLRCVLLVDTSDLAGSVAPSPPPEGGVTKLDAASKDGVAAGACPTGAIVCDDFENGFGAWDVHSQPNAKVELATDFSHSPRAAFKATTLPGGTGAFGSELRRTLPKLESGLFVFHAWVRFEGAYKDQTALVKLRAADGSSDMNLKIDEQGRLIVDADVPGEGPELTASEPVPKDRWVCLEWQARLGMPGRSTLTMDGKTVIDAGETNVPPGGYGSIDMGFVGVAGPNQRIWLDDIILSTAAVGCP